MKNSLTIWLIIAAFLGPIIICHAQSNKQDTAVKTSFKIEKRHAQTSAELIKLKGKVKSLLIAEVDKESALLDTLKTKFYTFHLFDTVGMLMQSLEASVCDPCPNNESFTRTYYRYDESRYKTKQISYAQDGTMDDSTVFKTNGNEMQELYYGPSVNYRMATYEYDDKDRVVKFIRYDNKGKVVEKKTSKFFPNKMIDDVITEGQGRMQTKDTYDDSGNVIESDQGVDVETFKYKYDKQGNWIIQKTYFNGKLFKTVKRVITYY